MIKIKIKDSFIAANPTFQKSFIINLSNEEGGAYGSLADGTEFSGMVMYVGCDLPLYIENEIFQVLVNNSISGSFPRFLNNLLHYVSRDVLEVFQDASTTPLTLKQITTYIAP